MVERLTVRRGSPRRLTRAQVDAMQDSPESTLYWSQKYHVSTSVINYWRPPRRLKDREVAATLASVVRLVLAHADYTQGCCSRTEWVCEVITPALLVLLQQARNVASEHHV